MFWQFNPLIIMSKELLLLVLWYVCIVNVYRGCRCVCRCDCVCIGERERERKLRLINGLRAGPRFLHLHSLSALQFQCS